MLTTNKSLLLTLTTCTSLCFVLTLAVYALLSGHNPLVRIRYALFVALLPALGTFIAFKLMRFSVAWWKALLSYLLLLALELIIQSLM